MLTRRSLFGFLAAAPIAVPVALSGPRLPTAAEWSAARLRGVERAVHPTVNIANFQQLLAARFGDGIARNIVSQVDGAKVGT